jgi:hypothetical protein
MEDKINSELETMKIQIELLETELEISRLRADNAEEELRQFKAAIRLSAKFNDSKEFITQTDDIPVPPPPPPPPPAPPLPLFNLHSSQANTNRSRSNSLTLSDAISDAQQRLQQTNETKVERKATGRE